MKNSHLNKVSHIFRVAVLYMLCTATAPLLANSFFTAYVEVKTPDKSQFKQASSEALLQILEKSTGRSANELLSHNTIKHEVDKASGAVQQFSYQQDTQQGVQTHYLLASFSKAKVRKLLQDANFKMLLDRRPSIAVVVILQHEGQFTILKPGSEVLDADYNDLLRSTTVNGINAEPITKSNLTKLSANKLWNFNKHYINSLATKFKVDNVLVIRLARVPSGRWVGGSTLISQSAPTKPFKTIELNNEQFSQVLNPLFKKINLHWLGLYAVKLSHSQYEVVLQVEGINNFVAFKQLTQELESMSVVDQVYILQTESQSVMLSVALKSDFLTFNQHLSEHKSLRASEVMSTDDTAEVSQVLHYLWTR